MWHQRLRRCHVAGKKSLFVHDPELDVVFAFYIIEFRVAANIGEKTKLADGLSLQAWRPEICKRIFARVVVVLVASREGAQREYRIVVEGVESVVGATLVGANSRALVGRADGLARERTPFRNGDTSIQVIERVRRLKPRARIAQVQVECIGFRYLKVQSIENVLLIPFIVHYGEFRAVKEAAAIQSVHGDKIPPVLAAIGKVESEVRSTKCTVGGGDRSVRSSDAEAGACGYVYDQTCLVAVVSWWSAGNNFHGLNGVHGNLI